MILLAATIGIKCLAGVRGEKEDAGNGASVLRERTKNMTAVHKQFALVVLVLALVLSGCSAISGDEAPAAGAGEEVAQATEAPEPTATAVEEPTATPEPEPTAVAIGPPPAFREELQATDPTTVVLGTGTPQVVELFAFW